LLQIEDDLEEEIIDNDTIENENIENTNTDTIAENKKLNLIFEIPNNI